MEDLQDVLNRGNGIALICSLVKCPNCNTDIWVDGGQHSGFDAVLDGYKKTECYNCLTPIGVDLSDMTNVKDMKYMTIDEHTELIFKKKSK